MMEEEKPNQQQGEECRELSYPVLPTLKEKSEIEQFSQARMILGFESILFNHASKAENSNKDLKLTLENFHDIKLNPLRSQENLVLN